MHVTQKMLDAHHVHDFTWTDKIYKAELIRFSSWFKTSATAGFKPTELHTTEYIPKRNSILDDGSGLLSEEAINSIRAAEDVQLDIIDVNISQSFEQAEKWPTFATSTRAWLQKSTIWRLLRPSKMARARNSQLLNMNLRRWRKSS